MAKKHLNTKERLEHIENKAFEHGVTSSQHFEQTGNFNSLRAAVMAYRCSMQSIRDQSRYKISSKNK